MSDTARAMDTARDTKSGLAWAVLAVGSDLPRYPARILCTLDANVSLRGADGVDVTFPLRGGVEYDLTPLRVNSVSAGSVIGIFGSPVIL